MKTQLHCLKIETTRAPEFIDITQQVRECVSESQVLNGLVVVFSRHTTAAIKINEHEPLLLQDMEQFLERMSPREGEYRHNDFTVRTVNMTEDECPNGHSHCQHLVLGTSETIPVIDGDLALGEFQRVFVVELDPERVSRQVLVQTMGV